MKKWFVYILRCGDNTLYTGSTDNVEKRVFTHNAGKGAKYTRGRLPVELVFIEQHDSRSLALKRESAIKSLSRAQKASLIQSGPV